MFFSQQVLPTLLAVFGVFSLTHACLVDAKPFDIVLAGRATARSGKTAGLGPINPGKVSKGPSKAPSKGSGKGSGKPPPVPNSNLSGAANILPGVRYIQL